MFVLPEVVCSRSILSGPSRPGVKDRQAKQIALLDESPPEN